MQPQAMSFWTDTDANDAAGFAAVAALPLATGSHPRTVVLGLPDQSGAPHLAVYDGAFPTPEDGASDHAGAIAAFGRAIGTAPADLEADPEILGRFHTHPRGPMRTTVETTLSSLAPETAQGWHRAVAQHPKVAAVLAHAPGWAPRFHEPGALAALGIVLGGTGHLQRKHAQPEAWLAHAESHPHLFGLLESVALSGRAHHLPIPPADPQRLRADMANAVAGPLPHDPSLRAKTISWVWYVAAVQPRPATRHGLARWASTLAQRPEDPLSWTGDAPKDLLYSRAVTAADALAAAGRMLHHTWPLPPSTGAAHPIVTLARARLESIGQDALTSEDQRKGDPFLQAVDGIRRLVIAPALAQALSGHGAPPGWEQATQADVQRQHAHRLLTAHVKPEQMGTQVWLALDTLDGMVQGAPDAQARFHHQVVRDTSLQALPWHQVGLPPQAAALLAPTAQRPHPHHGIGR